MLSFVPYAAMKLTWALGGTFGGITGAETLAAYERNGASGLWMTLERWGLDGTVLMALIGILLLFCPIRPWGLRLPRWLPLTPALIGAGWSRTACWGSVTWRWSGWAWQPPPPGDLPSAGDGLLVGWIGNAAFAGYGLALLAAARWYWHATRAGRVTGGR
ncbi:MULTISPECIES: hypothetical protein [unclassified Streptomyces]|uniref:hypothetical protein n=1 Tax=unclassified Streptomyces TaxID=2593676 RepID=UPI0030E21191